MNNERTDQPTTTAPTTSLSTALSSPMRLELVGLFTDPGPLSISDMADRLGRPATSLYHHVQVLEDAGVLRRAGTRPKGKRFEALFELTENRVELAVDPDDESAVRQASQTMTAALRMAERDFAAALERDDIRTDGPGRNLMGLRTHIRLSPDALGRLNERLQAIEDLLQTFADEDEEPGPDDLFVSLTLLLAPLRGRRVEGDHSSTPDPGDHS